MKNLLIMFLFHLLFCLNNIHALEIQISEPPTDIQQKPFHPNQSIFRDSYILPSSPSALSQLLARHDDTGLDGKELASFCNVHFDEHDHWGWHSTDSAVTVPDIALEACFDIDDESENNHEQSRKRSKSDCGDYSQKIIPNGSESRKRTCSTGCAENKPKTLKRIESVEDLSKLLNAICIH